MNTPCSVTSGYELVPLRGGYQYTFIRYVCGPYVFGFVFNVSFDTGETLYYVLAKKLAKLYIGYFLLQRYNIEYSLYPLTGGLIFCSDYLCYPTSLSYRAISTRI